MRKLRFTENLCLVLCVVLLACTLAACSGSSQTEDFQDQKSDVLESGDPQATPEIGEPDGEQSSGQTETNTEPQINFMGSSSVFAYDVREKRYNCAVADYVFIARIKDYLGGVSLDYNRTTWRVGTLLKVENLENLKGNLILGELSLVKEGGVSRDKTTGLSSPGVNYFPKLDSYWIILSGGMQTGAVFTDYMEIFMIPLPVDASLEPAEAMELIRETQEYQDYVKGVREQVLPESYQDKEITRYASYFEEDSENADLRETLFEPEWNFDDLYDLLPHEPPKREEQPKRQPSDYSSDEVVSMTVYPDDTIVYH